ncbi:hypothetical protein B296_00045013 [Ensete ventricosum]|uniref:P-type ATPase A domain-containing protein n=1 Tax=Ensete ventricosum TaxID=4639 RepID=A0A426XUH8_ENSVE|nr:hypothetical protein B296_00045013 [Ensete ventricosum]
MCRSELGLAYVDRNLQDHEQGLVCLVHTGIATSCWYSMYRAVPSMLTYGTLKCIDILHILILYRTGYIPLVSSGTLRWVKLSGTDLLPGDVVSIGRTTGQDGEDKSVPADVLLLAGNAIANEAILTGESTPQWKVVIISLPIVT